MISRINSILLTLSALLALPFLTETASAQNATVSARDYLRADLRLDSLIEEAFRAAKRVTDSDESNFAARSSVADALLEQGRVDDARLLIDRAAAAARKNSENPYLLSPIGNLYGQVHTQDEMHAFMTSLPERAGRASAGIGYLKGCIEREDIEHLRGAVGHLTAASYVGWSPEAEAWLAIGWRTLGEPKSARSYEDHVLEGPFSKEYESASGLAIRALINHALERDDLNEACRLIDTYAASPKVQGKDLYAVGASQVQVVRALASAGQFDRARERAKVIKSDRERATAIAEVGGALWKQKGAIAAEADLKKAGAMAKNDGVLSCCRVAKVFARVGFDEAAAALAWDTLVMIVEQEKGSRRELDAHFLAQTYLELGHEDAIQLFESELSEENSIDFIVTMAGLDAETGNLKRLMEVIDALTQVDEETKSSNHALQAVRTALWKLKDREQGDRFAAEFVREMVKRARALPSDKRAWLLGMILGNNVVEPVELSSYHAWSAPPTLAGNWKTPEDAGAAAALLAGVLGEFPMPQVRGIRKRALRFHPDAELFEFDGFRGGLRFHYLLLRVGEDVKLLDGTKEVIDPVALVASWRDSDEALFDLVHLSISSRAGQSGRFRVIESRDVLEELRAPGAVLPKLKLKGTTLIERKKDGATLEIDMLVSKHLQRITVTVLDSGQVSLVPKDTIAKDLPLELEFYIGGCFERRLVDLSEVWALHKTDEVAWAYGMAEMFALGFGEGGWRVDPSLAFYFLRIAKEKGHPNPFQLIGQAWRDGNGVAPDPAEAIEWLVSAASRGNLDACMDAAQLLLASPSPERRDRARTVLNFGKDGGNERCTAKLIELDAASKK